MTRTGAIPRELDTRRATPKDSGRCRTLPPVIGTPTDNGGVNGGGQPTPWVTLVGCAAASDVFSHGLICEHRDGTANRRAYCPIINSIVNNPWTQNPGLKQNSHLVLVRY